jgi:hypothetical protein
VHPVVIPRRPGRDVEHDHVPDARKLLSDRAPDAVAPTGHDVGARLLHHFSSTVVFCQRRRHPCHQPADLDSIRSYPYREYKSS